MMESLEHCGSAPLYSQLVSRIRRNLENGVWKLGDRIPTEQQLCGEFGVSRITVRRAVEALEEEGLLVRRQGKGTFVSAPYVSHGSCRPINSFHEACERLGKKPSSRVLFSGERPSTGRDRRELEIRGNGNVVAVSRIRFADGVPVVLERNRFSMAYSYLPDCDLSGSLYNLLRGYGVEPVSAVHDISLVFADEETARLLQISAGDPLVLLHELVYDDRGRPIHSSDQLIRGDVFTLRI